MSITLKYSDDRSTCTITIIGELRSNLIEEFRAASDKVTSQRTHEICFDLSECKYVDSTGIGMFLVFRDQMASIYEKNLPKLSILVGQDRLLEMLQVANLDKFYEISLAN